MTHAIISLKKNTHFLTYAFALCFTFFASTQLIAQVGINTTNPKANLDVTASNPTTPTNMDGLLVPRVSNFPSTSPTANQNGMLVFYTTSGGSNTPGFYYWNQPTTAWVKVTDENSIISQYWSKSGTSLSPTTTGDDLLFGNNEHITLKNASTTPDPFIYMYQSNGSNVERTILRENPSSAIDFSFNPTTNAFLFKNGTTNTVTIDVDNNTPLDVLGSISLGNTGNKYTLPNNNGNANDILVSDGAGNTSWTNFGSSNIGFWSKIGTSLSPTTTGDDLVFGNNEHISLKNASTTPDPFIYMYQSNGSNVERTILRENPTSAIDFSFNPTNNAFLFKNGTTNYVTIDVGNNTPLDVLGSISLGNTGNKYTLPNNNGSANQFLQTDGTGVASWVDLPIDTDHDFYKIGTTSSPTTIADNIFTQGRMVVGGTNFTNTNAVIQASKTGQSYIQVTSTDNGVTGFNLDRVGSQNYSLFSTAVSGISVLSFTRANGSFNGWSQDFTLDENGDFTIAAVTNELDNKVGIGINMVGFTEANKVTIKGHSNDASTTALKIKNLAENDLFDFKNSGELTIGGSTTGYTFPTSRGAVNQILQTDGNGNVSWVDNPSASFWSRTGNQLDVLNTADDIHFSSDQTSIIFPASTGSPAPMITMFDSGTANSNRMVIAHSVGISNYGLQYQDSDDSFRFLSNGNDKVVINLSALSTVPLVVSGTARATDFVSDTTTYPDYVFENYFNGYSKINSNYTFKTLSEIERFIKKEGHLPGVKSFKEIEKNGMTIDLAEISVANLEKIEELYLYAIELKKENQELKEKQKTLEERLAKIEAMLQKN